ASLSLPSRAPTTPSGIAPRGEKSSSICLAMRTATSQATAKLAQMPARATAQVKRGPDVEEARHRTIRTESYALRDIGLKRLSHVVQVRGAVAQIELVPDRTPGSRIEANFRVRA